MPLNSIRELPEEVRDVITSEEYVLGDQTLYDRFGLSGKQIVAYGIIFRDILLGRRQPTELLDLVSRLPDADTFDPCALALAIALTRLWPLSFYLKGVDIMIRRLGGRVPEVVPQPLPVSRTTAHNNPDEFLQGTAREILVRQKQFGELYITHKPLKDIDGRLKAPSANNWLQD